jgi:CRP/FNR family transcriptional regulator, cyclic AMP receptor protein
VEHPNRRESRRRFLRERTWLDYVADAIAGFSGSIYFVLLHVVWITLWFLSNTGHFFGFPKFDPYPLILLAMVISVGAVLLSNIRSYETESNDPAR